MIAIFKHYILRFSGLPLLLYFIISDTVWTIFSGSSSAPPEGLLLMYVYVDMFWDLKHFKYNSQLDLKLPVSFNKIWISKIFTFYAFVALAFSLKMLAAYFTENPILEILDRTLFGALMIQVVFMIAGRWVIFRSNNWKYQFSSLLAIAFAVLVVIGYVDGRAFYQAHYDGSELYSFLIGIGLAGNFLITATEYLLAGMKK